MDLGRVGIWSTALDALPPARAGEVAAELETLGWSALWFGEAYGREAFTSAQLLLSATSRLVVATGIANIWGRDALSAVGAAALLTAVSDDRFLLGLGVSHAPLVERLRGHDYGRPLAAMRTYLEAMDGYTSTAWEASRPRTPRVLAALGPAMLALSASHADGAHPYLVTPEHTAIARKALGPGKILAVEQAVVLGGTREDLLRRAHAHLEIYTGLPNYRNSWLRLGFTEDDLVRGGSERLADALVVGNDADAIRARVQDHLDAGASHVCLQVLQEGPLDVALDDWRELAPAVVEL